MTIEASIISKFAYLIECSVNSCYDGQLIVASI